MIYTCDNTAIFGFALNYSMALMASDGAEIKTPAGKVAPV